MCLRWSIEIGVSKRAPNGILKCYDRLFRLLMASVLTVKCLAGVYAMDYEDKRKGYACSISREDT